MLPNFATLADLAKLLEECVGRIQRARDLMLREAVSEMREEIAEACESVQIPWRDDPNVVQMAWWCWPAWCWRDAGAEA